jgi:hypothetical protein
MAAVNDMELALVTPAIARHVLWHFGQPAGVQPGRFTELLLSAIAIADEENTGLLELTFPGQVRAMRAMSRTTYGASRLVLIAEGTEL